MLLGEFKLMSGFEYLAKREKDLMIDDLRNCFCFCFIYAQMLGQAPDKIIGMGKTKHYIP